MNNQTHHNTRDHRFAYISTADISSWAKATTSFQRPVCKGDNRQFSVPVTDLDALRASKLIRPVPTVVHNPLEIVIDSDHEASKSAVQQEITKCDKSATAINNALEISDFINRKLGLLK